MPAVSDHAQPAASSIQRPVPDPASLLAGRVPGAVPHLHHARRAGAHIRVEPAAAGAVRVADRLGVGDDKQPALRFDLGGDLQPSRAVRAQCASQPTPAGPAPGHGPRKWSARCRRWAAGHPGSRASNWAQAADRVVIAEGDKVETVGARKGQQAGDIPGAVGMDGVGVQVAAVPARAAGRAGRNSRRGLERGMRAGMVGIPGWSAPVTASSTERDVPA